MDRSCFPRIAVAVRSLALLQLILSFYLPVAGQPSGGPYGPQNRHYELPVVEGRIFYASPDGDPDAPGDNLRNPTTLETAVTRIRSGDAIILRGGTYRTGDLEINQGVTIQPFGSEQPVMKGTRLAKDWKPISGGLWKTSWKTLFRDYPDDWWRRDRFGMETPMHIFNNDMVFADGRLLKSASWEGEVDENSFFVDYADGTVYIGTDPGLHQIEITAHKWGIHRVLRELRGRPNDHKGLIIKGITLTQYAFCALEIDAHLPEGPADRSTFGKDVVGSVIEDCTFSYCGRVGAHLRGDNLVLRNCKVHDTTTEGVYLMSSSDCLLERNMFSRNNIEDIKGYYPAAVKIFNQTHRVTCRDNLVYDLPLSNGIWYDVGNSEARFLNNWVMDVGGPVGMEGNNQIWPGYCGFFFEISKGALCAGNLFVNCNNGILILNSSGAEIWQNTFVNSRVCFGRDLRSAEGDHFGWHPSTGPGVEERHGHVFVNNLLTGDGRFHRPLMVVWQHPALCERLNRSPLARYEYNVYARDAASHCKTLVYWSPAGGANCQQAAESLAQLQELSGVSSESSRLYEGTHLPLFDSPATFNFRLSRDFGAAGQAAPLPAAIRELLGLPAKYKPYTGAYPPQ